MKDVTAAIRRPFYNRLTTGAVAAGALGLLIWTGCNSKTEVPKGAPKDDPTQVDVETGEGSDVPKDSSEQVPPPSTGETPNADKGEP